MPLTSMRFTLGHDVQRADNKRLRRCSLISMHTRVFCRKVWAKEASASQVHAPALSFFQLASCTHKLNNHLG